MSLWFLLWPIRCLILCCLISTQLWTFWFSFCYAFLVSFHIFLEKILGMISVFLVLLRLALRSHLCSLEKHVFPVRLLGLTGVSAVRVLGALTGLCQSVCALLTVGLKSAFSCGSLSFCRCLRPFFGALFRVHICSSLLYILDRLKLLSMCSILSFTTCDWKFVLSDCTRAAPAPFWILFAWIIFLFYLQSFCDFVSKVSPLKIAHTWVMYFNVFCQSLISNGRVLSIDIWDNDTKSNHQ